MAHVLRSVLYKSHAEMVRCQVPGARCSFCQFDVSSGSTTGPGLIFPSQCHVSTQPGLTSITFAVRPRRNSTCRSPCPVPTCALLEGGFLPDAMMILNMPMPAFSLASNVSKRLSSWVRRPYKGGKYQCSPSTSLWLASTTTDRYISLCHVPTKLSSHVSFRYYTCLLDRYFCSSGRLEV